MPSAPHAVPIAAAAKRLPLAAQPSRILVADDEFLVAAQVTHDLATLGFVTVGPAVDGENALTIARATMPDLALLDVQMPKRDGIAVAREMFADLGIPVIIISAYSDPQTVDSARDSGVFGYLVKPASIDQLRAAIQVAWKRFCDLALLADENDSLRKRLEERRVIEKAKWILVSRRGITEPDAMTLLQKKARDTRRPLVEVAQGVIDAEELMG
ncbi:MAG: response regulator [Phycisphaerae bacterium]|jgi:response regulator NasT